MGDIARRQVPPSAADLVAFDPAVALDYLGLNPEEPRSHALLGICQRYELDPLANHVIVIPGRPYPYVTRDGHLELAHRSGQLDGIQVLEEWQTERHCWAKVAVHRKDMGHPFVYTGRALLKMRVKGGGLDWDPNADKKAIANAEVRALKRAFPLQLPSVADLDAIDEERAATTVARAPAPVAEVAARLGHYDQQSGAGAAAGPPGGEPSPDPTSEPRPDSRSGVPGEGLAGSDPTSEGRTDSSQPQQHPRAGQATAPLGNGAPSDPTSAGAATSPAPPADQGASAPVERDTGVATGRPADVEDQPGGAAAGDTGETTGRAASEGEGSAAAPADPQGVGPVTAWCLDRPVAVGTARLYLSRHHPASFGRQGTWPLANTNDLDALRWQAADRAIELLAKQFKPGGEPKGWGGS